MDAFSAIAEPRRRELIDAVARGGSNCDVTRLVTELGWAQPTVSKHLGVLRRVGLVQVVKKGKRRVYSLNGQKLRGVYEWAKGYERFWQHQLIRVKERAEGTMKLGPNVAPPGARGNKESSAIKE